MEYHILFDRGKRWLVRENMKNLHLQNAMFREIMNIVNISINTLRQFLPTILLHNYDERKRPRESSLLRINIFF